MGNDGGQGRQSVRPSMLIIRKLLTLKGDKKDQTATKSIPLYVYCTVSFLEKVSRLGSPAREAARHLGTRHDRPIP